MVKKRKKTLKKSGKRQKVIVSENAVTDLSTWLMPQILYRPDRRDYILKVYKPEGCVFCHAKETGVKFESLVLFEGKHTMIIMNKFPYNSGHVLVVPKHHCTEVTELNDEQYEEFSQFLKICLAALRKGFNCAGFNVGMNLGKAAGAGIPDHLHQHVIPRWIGDANFLPLITKTKVMIETLDEVYQRLQPIFKEVGREYLRA